MIADQQPPDVPPSIADSDDPPGNPNPSSGRRWVHDGLFSLSACTPENPCTADGLLCGWSDELVDITPPAPSPSVPESGRADTDDLILRLRTEASWSRQLGAYGINDLLTEAADALAAPPLPDRTDLLRLLALAAEHLPDECPHYDEIHDALATGEREKGG